MWRNVLQNLVICITIGGLSIGAIFWGVYLRESGLPVVDFSESAAVEPVPSASDNFHDKRLRFAVAPMLETKATFLVYQYLVQWICQNIGREPDFVLCSSYKQIRESLEAGQTQAAFVCTGTYVHSLVSERLDLLAEPVYSAPFEYRCLLLVKAEHPAETIHDLRGATIAFTDPESFTGNLVPRALLAAENIEPETFFKNILYTGSHDRSIAAVSLAAADVVAVDALIWQAKRRENPALNDHIRVLWKSQPFPPPPVVVPAGTEETLKSDLQDAFLMIHKDPEGRKILDALGIDHFKIPEVDAYKAAAAYLKSLPVSGGL